MEAITQPIHPNGYIGEASIEAIHATQFSAAFCHDVSDMHFHSVDAVLVAASSSGDFCFMDLSRVHILAWATGKALF